MHVGIAVQLRVACTFVPEKGIVRVILVSQINHRLLHSDGADTSSYAMCVCVCVCACVVCVCVCVCLHTMTGGSTGSFQDWSCERRVVAAGDMCVQ